MDCVASLAVFLLITMMALFAGQSEAKPKNYLVETKEGGEVIFPFCIIIKWSFLLENMVDGNTFLKQ